jgi:hypothetical protein
MEWVATIGDRVNMSMVYGSIRLVQSGCRTCFLINSSYNLSNFAGLFPCQNCKIFFGCYVPPNRFKAHTMLSSELIDLSYVYTSVLSFQGNPFS